jgi:hypothetical protein
LHVRFGLESRPERFIMACLASAKTGGEQTQQKGVLFDHLVGEREQFVWNGETKRAGGLEIDHELEPGRLLVDRSAGLAPLRIFPVYTPARR